MEAAYPKRPSHFDRTYLRWLIDARAVNQIGADGVLLLTVIVLQEDQCRYSGPVDFWSGQLMHATGIASEDTLGRVRKRCVDARLLNYEPGSRSKPARYWVAEPCANPAPTPREEPQPCSTSEPTTADLRPLVRTMCGTSLPDPSPKDISADAESASGAEPKKVRTRKAPPKEKKPRPRNLLFDALAEVTNADVALDGSLLGKVASNYAKAAPPVTPDEVRDFAQHWRQAFAWAADAECQPTLSIGILQKHMSEFRAWRKSRPRTPMLDRAPAGFPDFDRQPPRG
ncbi:hypothetical protein FTUN_0600 [Frigoriglobus tundricola]|uniref:Uncharacterized protein n=1 Tax=Frigoriglobus tundricola TaxID=2774151 RepID=A0A6M5YGF1_9BACT|nr:hypothetical protein FTUN_0600 [Frigoriglobus tundricola]